jgi:predicted ABC-class ATPase
MGSTVGVHTDEEVQNLDANEKALLKDHILQHLSSSEDIRQIVSQDLSGFMDKNPEIQKTLKEKSSALLNRLKQK